MEDVLHGARLSRRSRAARRVCADGLLNRAAGVIATDAELEQIPHIRRNREREAHMEHRL